MVKEKLNDIQIKSVINEGKRILKEIVSIWLPSLKEEQYPKIIVYNEEYFYFWCNQSLAKKRLMIIIRFLNSIGISHSGLNIYVSSVFVSSFDIMAIEIYKIVYGEDEEFKLFLETIDNYIEQLKKSVEKLIGN